MKFDYIQSFSFDFFSCTLASFIQSIRDKYKICSLCNCCGLYIVLSGLICMKMLQSSNPHRYFMIAKLTKQDLWYLKCVEGLPNQVSCSPNFRKKKNWNILFASTILFLCCVVDVIA